METIGWSVLLVFIYSSYGISANSNFSRCHLLGEGPSVEYELQRRRVDSTTRGLRDFVAGQINHIVMSTSDENNDLMTFFVNFNERMSMLLLDLQELWAVDGHAEWRAAEAAEVKNLVQRRLHALQHPKNCTQARKLVCKVEQPCEFGCQLDHLVFCLSLAYGTRRTLVLDSRGWRYHAQGWEQVFHPLSENCTDYDLQNLNKQSSTSSEDKVVTVLHLEDINRQGPFMPPTIPEDLADRISRFSADPPAWWVGQLLTYILRPREQIAAKFNRTMQILYNKPIIGLQIEHTNKNISSYHPIEKYIFYVDSYYWTPLRLKYGTIPPKTVYLSTEDPRVLSEAKRKYPDIEFISNPVELNQPSSLISFLTDITLLSKADFVVCTFRSHVCRWAYALMQNDRPDAPGVMHSLEGMFHLKSMRPLDRVGVAYHNPKSSKEIELRPDDVISVSDHDLHWERAASGFNHRTNQTGEFPWFKTKETLRVHPFPTYDNVPLCDGEREVAGTMTHSVNLEMTTPMDVPIMAEPEDILKDDNAGPASSNY